MDAEVGMIDNASYGEEVEGIHHEIVELLGVFEATFGTEVVLCCHDSRFMVAAEEVDAVGVLYFEAHQEDGYLYCVYTAIHIVPQKY